MIPAQGGRQAQQPGVVQQSGTPDDPVDLRDVLPLEIPPPACIFSDSDLIPGVLDLLKQGYSIGRLEATVKPNPFAASVPGRSLMNVLRDDLERAPAASDVADGLVMTQHPLRLHDRSAREFVWAEARRVLKPGGVLITAHSSWALDVMRGASIRDLSKIGPPDELTQELVDAGFDRVHFYRGCNLHVLLWVVDLHQGEEREKAWDQLQEAWDEAHRLGGSLYHLAVATRRP